LSAEPFHITADPAFLYLSPGHKEALGCIIYGIEQRKGFVAISGEIGVGKTTVLRAYLEGVGVQGVKRPERIIYIFNANLSFPALLQTICAELDLVPRSKEVHEIVNQLQEALIEIYSKGQTVVLVIDEAQNMPVETLENLRMLSNLETSRDKLIQIILVGQPEFEAMLSRYELRQLNQRIAVRTRIKPLTDKDSVQYIYHRLSRVTDEPSEVFTPSAVRFIARQGRGAPRILNILADNALIAGFGYRKKPVTKKIVLEVARDYFGPQKSRRARWPFLAGAACAIAAGVLFIPFWKSMMGGNNASGPSGRLKPESSQSRDFQVRAPLPVAEPASASDSKSSAQKAPEASPAPSTAAGATSESPQIPAAQPLSTPGAETGPKAAGHKETDTDSSSSSTQTGSGAVTETAFRPPMQWVVKKGDNLSMIAQGIYGVSDRRTLEWIMSINPQIRNPNLLREGLTLRLPIRTDSDREDVNIPDQAMQERN